MSVLQSVWHPLQIPCIFPKTKRNFWMWRDWLHNHFAVDTSSFSPKRQGTFSRFRWRLSSLWAGCLCFLCSRTQSNVQLSFWNVSSLGVRLQSPASFYKLRIPNSYLPSRKYFQLEGLRFPFSILWYWLVSRKSCRRLVQCLECVSLVGKQSWSWIKLACVPRRGLQASLCTLQELSASSERILLPRKQTA